MGARLSRPKRAPHGAVTGGRCCGAARSLCTALYFWLDRRQQMVTACSGALLLTVPSAWPTATWLAVGEAAIWVTSPATLPDWERGGTSVLTCANRGLVWLPTRCVQACSWRRHAWEEVLPRLQSAQCASQPGDDKPSSSSSVGAAAALSIVLPLPTHKRCLLHIPHRHVLQRAREQVLAAAGGADAHGGLRRTGGTPPLPHEHATDVELGQQRSACTGRHPGCPERTCGRSRCWSWPRR